MCDLRMTLYQYKFIIKLIIIKIIDIVSVNILLIIVFVMSLDAGFRGLHGAQLALSVKEALDLDLHYIIIVRNVPMY